MIEFIDKSSENAGTPLNRMNMMAIQGFQSNEVKFIRENGKIISIEETNAEGHKLITTFNSDGSIVQRFVGEKTITKTTTVDSSGNIREVIS